MKKRGFIYGILCGLALPLVVVALLAVFNVGSIGSLLQTAFILQTKSYTSLSFAEKTRGAIDGMMSALDDPYSYYLNKDEFSDLMTSMEGYYEGIGIYIAINEAEEVYILSPIKNTPAFKAGMQAGDKILSVNGVSTEGMIPGEVADSIKTSGVTPVDVVVERDGQELSFNVELAEISIPTVEGQYLEGEDGVGYIAVSSFSNTTPTEFDAAYQKLLNEGDLRYLIMDLRNDPGGSVAGATGIASMFVPAGEPIYWAEEKSGESSVDSTGTNAIDLPMVLLVNENSASAAEILAGCLQDYGIATVVGVQSFGKGIIQTIYRVSDGAVKVTSAKYLTPNKNEIHEIGVTPDIVVELSGDSATDVYTLDPAVDNQLKTAIDTVKSMDN